MRLLHTSDWHLGRIFYGLHLTDDQHYVLEQLVNLVAETRPDAVVIAGDLYDRAVPPTEAVELLDETLYRIVIDKKTPVLAVAGNHDSPERLGFGRRLLAGQGLHMAGRLEPAAEPVVICDHCGPVYFVPLPYCEPAVVREKLAIEAADHDQALRALVGHWRSKVPAGARAVAIAHAFIAGGTESESERPLSVGGSGVVDGRIFTPFTYTALGHLHNAQSAGADNIRYPGSLLKYSFAEAGQKKGVNLVEIGGDGQVTVRGISLTPRHEVRRLDGMFADLLRGPAAGEPADDYIMVTIRDREPLLDARGRLQKVYPNILHLERPGLGTNDGLRGPDGDHRRLGEKELFAAFFSQVAGQQLSPEQGKEFDRVVDELHRQEREGGQ